MKKIISLLLVTLLLIVACPVFAADATSYIQIVSVSDGDTFVAGSPVSLLADTDLAASRIDFYANGIKIPGTVTDTSKALLWAPKAGSYELTAKVTATGGGTTTTTDSVSVLVTDPDVKMMVQLDEASDVTAFEQGEGSGTRLLEEHANSEYTKLSSYSAPWINHGERALCEIRWEDDEWINVADYSYLNMWIYSNEAFTTYAGPWATKRSDTGAENSRLAVVEVKQGWNLVTIELRKKGAAETHSPSMEIYFDDYFKGMSFNSRYPNSSSCTYSANREVYIDSVFASKEIPAAKPVAVTPSIPDEKTDVCNELKRYTLSFNQAMNEDTLKAENVTVTKAGSVEPIVIESVKTTADTMELTFADSSFENAATYTVALKNKIESLYGVSVGDNCAFSFTTVASCDAVDPIPSFVYPKSGATVASNNVTLAAKVIFDGNVDSVEFFKSDNTSIGVAKKGSNGEYYYTTDQLAAGSYSVYAKITYNTSETKTTENVNFTVAEAETYAITGITDGEQIFINTGETTVLSKTIGLSTTEKVSKVVYRVDGQQKASTAVAPFTWEMPFEDTKSHEVSAYVYDTMGNVSAVAPVSYQAMYVATSNIIGDDFDNGQADAEISVAEGKIFSAKRNDYGSAQYSTDPVAANQDLVAKINVPDGTNDSNRAVFVTAATIPASKLMRIDFDLYVTNPSWVRLVVSQEYRNGPAPFAPYHLQLSASKAVFKSGTAWNHVTILCDFNALTSTIYVNDAYFKTDVLDSSWKTAKIAAIEFTSEQGNSYYMDNIFVDALTPMSATAPLVDAVTFTDNITSWNADFIVTNLTNAVAECTIFYAVYDANDNLVAVDSEKVDLVAGGIAHKTYNVLKTYGDKTGTKIRGFVWESVSGVTTCRPLGEMN